MSAAALSPLLATLAIAALLAACTSLASALTTPLPPVYPPTTRTNTTASGKYSTNLAALYFNDNTVAMQRAVNRSFSRLDTDRDGSLSIHELTSAINRTAEDGGDVLPAGIAAQMSAVNGKLAQMDTDRNGVISQQEFGTVLATALTKNFTIFPAICLEVQERLALCQLDPAQNVTDPNLPTVDGGQPATATIGQIAAREANKCASGAAGLQGDFAFQNCVLGNTCGDLIVNCFSQVMSGADAVFTAATNRFLDDQIPALTGLPSDDPTFRAYMTEGTQVSAKEAALQVFGTTVEGGVLAGLMTVLGKLLMDAIIPLLAKEATWAAIATFITGLGPHAWFIFLGVSFGLGVLALIVMQFKNLVEIVRGLWPRNDYNRLMMDSYDPYDVNSIGPRCNWATYFPNGSSSPDSLEKDLWGGMSDAKSCARALHAHSSSHSSLRQGRHAVPAQ